MEFIDIHNHLAWEIDDGMPSKEDAVIALEQAKKDGITKIISTPHFVPGTHDLSNINTMNERIDELKDLAESYGIEIYRGAEVFMNHEYLDMIDSKAFNTLADSKYLLVEFDVRRNMDNNDYAEDYLYELHVRGYRPIIAHAERYFPKGIDLDRIQSWIEMGCYIQVNRTSLLGTHGDVCRKNAEKLLREGFVHVVASDAHRCVGHRIVKLSDVYSLVEKEYGKDNADLLLLDNPKHIINDEELEEMEVIKKKSIFDRFRKKGR